MKDLIDDVPTAFLRRHELDHVIPLFGLELHPEGYDPEQVAMAALNNFIWTVRASRLAVGLAQSWRKYHVTSTALVYNFETSVMGVFVGAAMVCLTKLQRCGCSHCY